jgi:hypothetical protein
MKQPAPIVTNPQINPRILSSPSRGVGKGGRRRDAIMQAAPSSTGYGSLGPQHLVPMNPTATPWCVSVASAGQIHRLGFYSRGKARSRRCVHSGSSARPLRSKMRTSSSTTAHHRQRLCRCQPFIRRRILCSDQVGACTAPHTLARGVGRPSRADLVGSLFFVFFFFFLFSFSV